MTAECFKKIIESIGEDTNRPGLVDTPERAFKAFSFLTKGYGEDLDAVIKVARIVDMFARRLQIQENLVNQVAQTIEKVTDASGVAVIVEAKHMCMMMRGVEKQNSSMKTSAMLGCFRDQQATRNEFLSLIKD